MQIQLSNPNYLVITFFNPTNDVMETRYDYTQKNRIAYTYIHVNVSTESTHTIIINEINLTIIVTGVWKQSTGLESPWHR